MPVYNGNSKAKDLYYGGTKIEEAYYGGTKVYSSGPLYYCYKSGALYAYTKNIITIPGIYQFYGTSNLSMATDSSQLGTPTTNNVTSVSGNDITITSGQYTFTYTYKQEYDLYT